MNFKLTNWFVVAIVLLLLASCARRGRPSGGPKDELPPILITANPEHLSTNFEEEKIRIRFDEYIKLKEINQQLVISPPLENQPIITPVGTASQDINIRIIDTLKPNTTYTFNFGNSVVDNNEENPLAQFKYVFSTGDYIDSLAISGTISDAYNLETEENISVQLYEVTEEFSDSIIYKERPSYVANTLDSVAFELTNLKEGTYLMVALKDVSRNYKFDPKADKIGYHPTYITIPNDTVFKLKLFSEVLPFRFLRPSEYKMGQLYFGYEGDPTGAKIKLLSEPDSIINTHIVTEKDMDTLSYWHTPIQADSLLFEVSKNEYIDTLKVFLRKNERDSLRVSQTTTGVMSLKDTFAISSNVPMININKSQITILDRDSLPVNFTTHLSASKQELKLNFNKKFEETYNIRFLPSAIEDLFGDTNDTLTMNARTGSLDMYGAINLNIQNADSYPFILEILDGKMEVIDQVYVRENRSFKFEYLSPDDYQFRIIYDINENGKWDTGNFLRRSKPEEVLYRKGKVEIKANWEQAVDFDLKLK